jgi:hypothetical protein
VLRIVHDCDLKVFAFIQANDPFQWSIPSWKYAVWPLLPPEVWPLLPPEIRRISIEECDRMAVKVVAVTEAPNPMHGKVSHNQDFIDVMAAIKNPATDPTKKATAIVVSMSDPSWATKDDKGKAKYQKPEVVFAGLLRRHFTADGLSLTAYASGKMEVTIRKGEPTKKRK